MAFLPLLAIGATAVGAGIQAYGAYQGGQAQKAYYNYQAGVQQQLAGIARLKGARDIMAGDVEAQKYGIRTAQITGGTIARAGAGNVSTTGGSVAALLQSQRATGLEEQQIARQTAGERAYGEYVEAAAKTASAGALGMAGQQAATAGEISAVGDVISGIGSAASMGLQGAKFSSIAGGSPPVSSKWYEGSDLMTGTGPTTGPPLNLIG
jgi:hypothetical protein